MLWTATELLVVCLALAGGVLAGWWWAARGSHQGEHRRNRREERRAYLRAVFEQLQALHWALVSELDAGRSQLLGEAREARMASLTDDLRAADLHLRARRFLLTADLATQLTEAVELTWQVVVELAQGAPNPARAADARSALTAALAELERVLRQELGPRTSAPPPQHLAALEAALAAGGEPGQNLPPQVNRFDPATASPPRGGRTVDLSAFDEPDEPPPPPPRPRKLISLE